MDTYPLGGASLDILEDKTGKLTIKDVITPDISRRFQPNRQEEPNFGMTDSAFWFRFTIDDRTGKGNQWLLLLDHPLMFEADLFIPRKDGSFIVRRSGTMRPMSARDIQDRNIILPLGNLLYPETFYLRARMQGRSQFPLTVLSPSAYEKSEARHLYITWAYTGFMASLVFINLSIYFLLKGRNHLYFALYILSNIMLQLTLFGHMYAGGITGKPGANDFAVVTSFSLTVLTALLFCRSFLHTEKHAPRMDKILRMLILLNLTMIPLYLFISPLTYKKLLMLNLTITWLATIAAAICCCRKDYAPARIFLYSRFVIWVGVWIWMLNAYNLIPITLLAKYVLLTVSVVEAGFIVFALAERFRFMNRRIGNLVTGLQQEVKERSAANRALEAEMAERNRLEREIVKISDNERLLISHELHDGLCQQLIGLRIRWAALQRRLSVSREGAEIGSLGQMLDEAVDQAYDISRGLWPLEYQASGLPPSLKELADRLSQQSGIAIEFHQKLGCNECSGEYFTQIGNIAREAVTNAVKHSRATLITVCLECRHDLGIVLEVRDNGTGRLAKPASTIGGMGVSIMKHRAALIGGSLTMHDAEGGGTVVACTAPCSGPPSAEGNHA